MEAPLSSRVADYTGKLYGLKLFSPALDRPEWSLADICAIGYRLSIRNLYDKWSDVYALYREIVDPKVTFDDYLGSGYAVAARTWQSQLLIGDNEY